MSRVLALLALLTAIPAAGLHGQIVHAIGRRIVNGAIRPGELLPADSHLRASRTVVREAIKVLAAKGLVESRPRRERACAPPESWNLLDPDVLAWQQEGTPQPVFLRKLTEVRLIVEPAAAELAARRVRAAELPTLRGRLPEMKAALAAQPADYEAFDQADIVFHRAILRLATTTCSSR
jgi:DNA-binding FadR family transcriptional regulator